MKWSKWLLIGCVAIVGCGGEPPIEKAQSALTVFATVPGHNKAEASDPYGCSGWSYRLLFGWEQHMDPGSPTGWYAAVGGSIASVGTVNDVSADVYLQCYWGILPAAGNSRLSTTGYQGIPCSITTVWPSSWHATNPTQAVTLDSYDYQANGLNGTISLGLSSATAPYPGSGWCGNAWYVGRVTNTAKFNGSQPPPPVDPCRDGYGYDPGPPGQCVVLPPCDALVGDATNCTYFPPIQGGA